MAKNRVNTEPKSEERGDNIQKKKERKKENQTKRRRRARSALV